MVSAQEALDRLRAGNQRFAAGIGAGRSIGAAPAELADGQEPFAIVLGCSDSRVPAEIVFDQGLGDLFVIRVAGNIVAPSQIGSVEFAVTSFATQLVVVLGHSNCGAVLTTVEQLQAPTDTRSRNLRSIVNLIRPSVEQCIRSGTHEHQDALVERAVRANIHASVRHLRRDSEILQEFISENRLRIIGAEYSLDTGRVEFLDDAGSDTG
ncbi:carbonic anhydrase [Gammaproteobacteria bacterium]|jgi:carbonic anhydrase|nr:carbonic anhydrase [Gammaproteobacteria bacterium]